jgi:glycosyltransferase involved in cell wall biosynthesis
LDVTHLIKVLHLWKSDSARFGGGGAAAMYRLHSNLRKHSVDSQILCEHKTTDSPHVKVIKRWSNVESLIKRLTSRIGLNDIHRISSFLIKQHEAYQAAEILNFHGIHSSFISYLALPSLTEKKPSIFTLHDMWCLTGHCAISYDCDLWKSGCGHCPYPDAYPPVMRDATRVDWKLKEWVYNRSNLVIVTPSTWLTKQAKQSMLKRFPIYHIPEGVDMETYKPQDSNSFRSLLNIPKGKKILMFAAVDLNQFSKGGDLLLDALGSLPGSLKKELVLLLLGNQGESIGEASGIRSINLGYVSDDHLKVTAYSAADLFILPTRAEAFGLVALESMACGTPVVSFRVGGVTDLVRPGVSGYLADPENANDLRDGIVQLIDDECLRNNMGHMSREIAQKEFSSELETKKYIDLYNRLL